jgi:hypothetical protein
MAFNGLEFDQHAAPEISASRVEFIHDQKVGWKASKSMP